MVQAEVLVNLSKDDIRQDYVHNVFPNGVPANERTAKTQIETFFDLRVGALNAYNMTRVASGNILIRKQPVFGE